MDFENYMTVSFKSVSQNEAFARVTIAAFVTQLDPTVSDVTDIKTAVSEAVTNCIIHGYENEEGIVHLSCGYSKGTVYIDVWDDGNGITDIEEARQPLFTSKPEMERSGMGFTVMEMFMDNVTVESSIGKGTKISMSKLIKNS